MEEAKVAGTGILRLHGWDLANGKGIGGCAPWAETVEPVFMVGAPRSGTTWLQAVLGTHPEIYTGTETWFFAAFASAEKVFAVPRDRRIGLPEYWRPREFYDVVGALFRRTISALPPPPRVPRYFLEKTNLHCHHAGFILKVFPAARFLHVLRDGRAVVASLRRAAGTWWRFGPFLTVDMAARDWERAVRASQGIRQMVGTRQFLEVRYESLRTHPEMELESILDWLGVEGGHNLVSSMLRRNGLQESKEAESPFPSIAMPRSPEIRPRVDTAYPPGFVGSAPLRLEDVDLSRLARLRVECLVGELLAELGYPPMQMRFRGLVRILTSPRLRRMLRLNPL